MHMIFIENIACTSRAHCKACRADRDFRRSLAQHYAVPGDLVDFDCPIGLPILGPVTDEIAVPMTVGASGLQGVTASPPSAEQVAEQRIRQRASAAFAAGCKAVGIKMFCCGDHIGAALVAAVPQGKLLQDEPAALAWLTGQLKREATGDDYMAFMDAVYEAWNAGANAAPTMPQEPPIPEVGPGPGRWLAAMIEEAVGHSLPPCRLCALRANMMNEWGVLGCVRNLITIKGWLAEERARRGLPVDAKVIGRAIRGAFKVWRKK